MRALMALGAAWSILICATPGLADRYVTNPQPASEPAFAKAPVAEARVLPAFEIRAACRPVANAAGYDDAEQVPGTGSVILARYGAATGNPFKHSNAGPQPATHSTGLCR